MRRIELVAALPAPADAAWAVFIDTARWPEWGRLVRSAEGEFEPGRRWTMTLRPERGDLPRVLRPRFVALGPGSRVVFETVVGAAWAVRMVHTFEVLADGPEASILRQTFSTTGLLVRPLWPRLAAGMHQFDAVGDDLAARLAEPARARR